MAILDRIEKMYYNLAYSTFDENMQNHLSVYVSFPQYLCIVQKFLKCFVTKKQWRKKERSLSVFTGLCITPVQWFNYCLTPIRGKKAIEVRSLDDIKRFYADPIWIAYHKFLISLRCSNFGSCERDHADCINNIRFHNGCQYHEAVSHIKFHRYFLTVGSNVKMQDGYYLPRKAVVEEQLNKMSLQFPDTDLVRLASDLRAKDQRYSTPDVTAQAYHIVDSGSGGSMKMGRVLATYFQDSTLTNININTEPYKITKYIKQDAYELMWQKKLPLDFILFGHGAPKVKPLFALGCEVSHGKVKLSLLTRDRVDLLIELVNNHLLA